MRASSRSSVSRWIGFRLGATRLLVPADAVGEVIHSPPATPVPGTKTWLRGLASTQGRLLSIVDLKRFLGGEEGVPGAPLLLIEDGEFPVGLAVDEVLGLHEVPGDARDGPPTLAEAWLRGWVTRHHRENDVEWGILDLAAVLRDDGFRQAAA